jgi:hypothetical protein
VKSIDPALPRERSTMHYRITQARKKDYPMATDLELDLILELLEEGVILERNEAEED